MDSTSSVKRSAGRQLTPHGMSTEHVAPVWTKKDAAYLTKSKSEEELLDLYDEEWFVANHDTNEGQDKVVAGSQRDLVRRGPDTLAELARVFDERKYHQCCPAGYTLLFDIAIPESSNADLALRSLFDPTELCATYQQTIQPTLAGPLCEAVSQMLEFDVYDDEVQETAFEYAPKHEGRSLMRPPPMFDDVELDKPISDEHEINEQGKIIKKRVPICLEVNASPRDWEVEYDRVLRNISGGTFLPGLEHLTNIESRSAFISYDQDIQALHQATAEFLADRNDGECNCLDGKVGAFVLPGDNFLLAENNTGLGLTLDHPTAESLFDLIDNAVDEAFLVDEFDAEARCLPVEFTRFGRPVYEWYTSTTQSEKSPRLGAFFDPAEQRYTNFTALDHLVQCPSPRPGAFFDGVEQRYTNFTALDQLLQCPSRLSGNVRAQDSATDDISAVSYTDDEVDELPMMQIPKLHYYDAGSQQYVGYTAFNQLLADAEDELSTPRIHRMDDTFDETDFDLVDGLREINELANDDKSDNCEGDVNLPSPFTDFDFGLDVLQRQVEPNPNASRRILSIKDLRSSTYVWRTKLMKRPRLMVVTQLDTIAEVLSDDDVPSGDSSPSSDASIDFAGRRGFVQALPTRRTNFLDDEDLYECEPAAPQWVSDLDDSDELRVPAQTLTYEDEPEAAQPVNRPDELLFSAPTSPTNLVENVYEFSSDAMRRSEPQTISSPVFQAQTPTDPFPHLDLLQALDTEINALLAFTFECMNDGRIHQLQALGSDLHWALSALASEYSGFALMERLGTAVEVLLQHIATSGSN